MNKIKVKTRINNDKSLCEMNGMQPSEVLCNEKGEHFVSFDVLDFSDEEVNEEKVENCEDALTMVLLNSNYTSSDDTGYNYNSHFCFKTEDEARAFVWFETIEDSRDDALRQADLNAVCERVEQELCWMLHRRRCGQQGLQGSSLFQCKRRVSFPSCSKKRGPAKVCGKDLQGVLFGF